jgi:outer membrane protein assembly factor BamB
MLVIKNCRFLCVLCVLCVSAVSLSASAENRPQWRGPNRDGIVTEKNLAPTWPQGGPKRLWEAPIGPGYASPVAADGKVYAFYFKDGKDVLECFDANTGKSVWRQSYAKGYVGDYAGTRATPTIDGNRIYTYGGNSQLVARNLADGKQLWMVDVFKETGGRQKTWGISGSPLVDEDRVYVQSGDNGNAAVGVDKKSGKVLWKSEARGGGYASPVMADVGGRKHLVLFAQEHALGVDPATGKTIWELNEPWETEYGINAAMPIVSGGKVFLTCAYKDRRAGLYEITADGVKPVWGSKAITGRFQPPILDNGHLYVNSEGTLKCVRWADGKVVWEQRNLLGMGGSILRVAPDKLIGLTDRGRLIYATATPEGFKKIAQLDGAAQGEQVWATPAVHNGKLFVKGQDELVAYDIGAK